MPGLRGRTTLADILHRFSSYGGVEDKETSQISSTFMSDDDGRSDRESRSGPLHLTGRAARTRFVIEVLALHHLDRLLLLTSSAEPPEVGPRHAAPHARYALLISFADAVSHLSDYPPLG